MRLTLRTLLAYMDGLLWIPRIPRKLARKSRTASLPRSSVHPGQFPSDDGIRGAEGAVAVGFKTQRQGCGKMYIVVDDEDGFEADSGTGRKGRGGHGGGNGRLGFAGDLSIVVDRGAKNSRS